jgi:NADH:quinone reductase (non-electrogenic)
MTENTEVVVVGGGYAGVMAANRLTQRGDLTVTLINPHPTFVERIRLHQLVGGSHERSSITKKSWARASGWLSQP